MKFKNVIRRIVSIIAYPVPLNWWIKLSGINVIYPFYHTISDQAPAHVKHLYKVRTVNQFRRDLDFLVTHFKSIHSVPSNPLQNSHNSFFLSFDDGLAECFDIIAPILDEYNIKATFFVNTDYIDNKDLFYKYKASMIIDCLSVDDKYVNSTNDAIFTEGIKTKRQIIKKLRHLHYNERHLADTIANLLQIDFSELLMNRPVYMTGSQLEELISAGHTIAGHGKGHCLFSGIPYEKQTEEVADCLKYLESEYKVKDKLFAFPFTDDKLKTELFQQLKNQHVLEYSFGTAGIKKDAVPFNIQRIAIEKHAASAKRTIKTEYALYILKWIFNRHIIRRG